MVICVPASACPATAPVTFCASTGDAARVERQRPMAMQRAFLRNLRVLLIGSFSPRCSWLWRGHEVVVPLVEVQVAAAPLGFPALQVHRFRTEMLFRRHQLPAVIVVEGDA